LQTKGELVILQNKGENVIRNNGIGKLLKKIEKERKYHPTQ